MNEREMKLNNEATIEVRPAVTAEWALRERGDVLYSGALIAGGGLRRLRHTKPKQLCRDKHHIKYNLGLGIYGQKYFWMLSAVCVGWSIYFQPLYVLRQLLISCLWKTSIYVRICYELILLSMISMFMLIPTKLRKLCFKIIPNCR